MMKFDIEESALRNLYIDKELTQKEIAIVYGCGYQTIVRRMQEFNIPVRPKANERIELTSIQEQALVGSLLSDGTINNPKRGNSRFSHASAQREMVQYIIDLFENFQPNTDTQGFSEYSYYYKKYNNTYTKYTFETVCNPIFTEARSKWYPAGEKIVPKDIRLSPLACKLWLLGDGTLANGKGKNGIIDNQSIKFHTNSFSVEDVEFLISQMGQFEAYLYRKKCQKNQPLIVIPRRKIKQFLDYIGECPVECYKYKWAFQPYKINLDNEITCANPECVISFMQKAANQEYCSPKCRRRFHYLNTI